MLGDNTPDRSLSKALGEYRSRLVTKWISQFGLSVCGGPFEGMRLLPESAWGDGDLLSKLVGAYEAELHGVVHGLAVQGYKRIVNIGCAEGYYAVGLALTLPRSRVIAFDTCEAAQNLCRNAAALNEVGGRVEVYGNCITEALASILAGPEKTFVLSDCEGAETYLLDPRKTPALLDCDLLIECHDFACPKTTDLLRRWFDRTHSSRIIFETGRDLALFPLTAFWSSLDRAVAFCEFRPCRMHWLLLVRNP